MLVVLLLLAAGGGWLWYRENLSPASSKGAAKAPARDVANLLKAGADSFEEDGGWDLRAAGVAMALSGAAHSGQGACEAAWAKPEAGQKASDFALARLKEPLNLLPGESLELSGWIRTSGAAKAAPSRCEATFCRITMRSTICVTSCGDNALPCNLGLPPIKSPPPQVPRHGSSTAFSA